MPRRYRAEAYSTPPSWISIWEEFYAALEPQAAAILRPTGFYEQHDLEVPPDNGPRCLEGEEKAIVERIASALTIAAHSSHRTPAGVVQAWLRRVVDDPQFFWSPDIPSEVYLAVVSSYRRDEEAPGTHLQDVFGEGRVNFEAEALKPSLANIARAAQTALESFPRQRGRPASVANRLGAQLLAPAFRSIGGKFSRRQSWVDAVGGGVRLVEDGDFYHFVEQVAGCLKRHLRQYRLPPATSETIERIATELRY